MKSEWSVVGLCRKFGTAFATVFILCIGTIFVPSLHAQSSAPDSIVQIAAEIQGLEQVPPNTWAQFGTYWEAEPNASFAPLPCPPFDPTLPVYAIANGQYLVDATGGRLPRGDTLTAIAIESNAVVNLIIQVQDAAAVHAMSMAMAMDSPPLPGGGGGSGGTDTNTYAFAYEFDTNLLWLEITNVSDGLTYVNLHNGTNQVYAIWSTTNLAEPFTNWQVETEVWPTDTNCMPFNTYTFGRDNLFLRAQDWTGLFLNGLPCWWSWYYFHTLDVSWTDRDAIKNSLGYDYTNGIYPDTIAFGIMVTNFYVTTANPIFPLYISNGVPGFIAVLVNSNSTSDITWQSFATPDVTVTLGPDGDYTLTVGLKGFTTNAPLAWQTVSFTKDTTPPTLVITRPTGNAVTQSSIQFDGYADEPLQTFTYDLSNDSGTFTNQTGFLTGLTWDSTELAYTTNYFESGNVGLAAGSNLITLHAMDWAGNKMDATFILNFSPNTNLPVLSLTYPTVGAPILKGDSTLQAHVSDPETFVTATFNGATVPVVVDATGSVWMQRLNLNSGTNGVTLTAKTALGSVTTTNFTIVAVNNDAGLTVNSLSDSDLNQGSIAVSGTISSLSTYCVYVNGVKASPAYAGATSQWSVSGVPVNSGGMAILNVQVYTGDPVLVATTNIFYAQPLYVSLMSYSGRQILDSDEDNVNWTYDSGGILNDYEWGPLEITPATNEAPMLPDWGFEFSPPWEFANITVSIPDYLQHYESHTQTHVMVEPSGVAQDGTTNCYLVLATACEFSDTNIDCGNSPTITGTVGFEYGLAYFDLLGSGDGYYGGDVPLPPEWLQINGQSLMNTGLTNVNNAFIGTTISSVWGATVVSGPAGDNLDVTPVAMQVYKNWDYTFDVKAYDVTPRMLVDLGRNGTANELTTPGNPYRFWINDAQEKGDISSSQYYVPGSASPNYADSQVNGHADVVNFFPISLSMSNTLQMLPLTNNYEYHLSQADGAVKIAYSSLMPTNAFDYLTNLGSHGYGTNFSEGITNADTIQVTSGGITLDTNFLNRIQNNGGLGVILAEGCSSTTNPLMLEIWRNGQRLASSPLFLSISDVEQMYRWINLRHVLGQTETMPTAAAEPANYPDSLCDGKQFIFVHGYSVSETSARGWSAEMFKRLYQSDSHAMFTAVTWYGNDGQIASWVPFAGGATPDYYTNVANAFLTSSNLTVAVNSLPGQKYIAGHSLGNMVVSSAIADWGLNVNAYFMLDAAVAIEAYNASASDNLNLLPPPYWTNYSNRLWASKWYQLFDSSDGRNALTWSNRFGNIAVAYNYYSTNEDVLNNADGTMHNPFVSEYAWVNQEMRKGSFLVSLLANGEAGWGFNIYYSNYSIDQANTIPDSQLQTNSFFGSFDDANLYTPSGSANAANYNERAQILGDGIPALSNAAGRNTMVNSFGVPDADREMNTYRLGGYAQGLWPMSDNRWHHSDIVNVAFPFNYEIFNQMVTDGGFR